MPTIYITEPGAVVRQSSQHLVVTKDQTRLAQYERHLDAAFSLKLARAFVAGKIRNGRALILRYLRNHPENDFSQSLKLIEQTLENLAGMASNTGLMGAEGSATAAYFRAYGQMFRRELVFETRTRRQL